MRAASECRRGVLQWIRFCAGTRGNDRSRAVNGVSMRLNERLPKRNRWHRKYITETFPLKASCFRIHSSGSIFLHRRDFAHQCTPLRGPAPSRVIVNLQRMKLSLHGGYIRTYTMLTEQHQYHDNGARVEFLVQARASARAAITYATRRLHLISRRVRAASIARSSFVTFRLLPGRA